MGGLAAVAQRARLRGGAGRDIDGRNVIWSWAMQRGRVVTPGTFRFGMERRIPPDRIFRYEQRLRTLGPELGITTLSMGKPPFDRFFMVAKPCRMGSGIFSSLPLGSFAWLFPHVCFPMGRWRSTRGVRKIIRRGSTAENGWPLTAVCAGPG